MGLLTDKIAMLLLVIFCSNTCLSDDHDSSMPVPLSVERETGSHSAGNRPVADTVQDPSVAQFCNSPLQAICASSEPFKQSDGWPKMFSQSPQDAFETGKQILGNMIKNNQISQAIGNYAQRVNSSLQQTIVLERNVSGPLTYPGQPPQIHVPPGGWNLFSVFHELGHVMDFQIPKGYDYTAVACLQNNRARVGLPSPLVSAEYRQEIAADRIAAKGFAYLASPSLRKSGSEPLSPKTLLKVLRGALGFLCNMNTFASSHPSGRFRINYVSNLPELRKAMGCENPTPYPNACY